MPHCRVSCNFGTPSILGASSAARNNSQALQSFVYNYPSLDLVDSHTDTLWKGPIFQPVKGTFDGYLLDNWHDGKAVYDGIFVNSLPNSSQVGN